MPVGSAATSRQLTAPPSLKPQPVRAEADDEGGRGLALVESCSDDWGVADYTDKDAGVTGKAVWCALAPPKPAEQHG